MLHYVGITSGVFNAYEATEHAEMWAALHAQCKDLEPGFHRLSFEGGRVLLTVCVGAVQAVLRELDFQADSIFLGSVANEWVIRLLTRLCRRGTQLWGVAQHGADVVALIRTLGFDAQSAFNPSWEVARRVSAAPPARVAVIGAGLSGAAIARLLALRGWQVTVLDQEAAPAGGASGLPAGLAVPDISADDNPRSRLIRRGIRYTLYHAQHLLRRGHDWEPSGVTEIRPNGAHHWHGGAAWIKPRQLVNAWMAHTHIQFIGNCQIVSLHRNTNHWLLQDADNNEYAGFSNVIIANAIACKKLLLAPVEYASIAPEMRAKLDALQAVHGTLSCGVYGEEIADLPPTPVNGHGCFLPHVPDLKGTHWYAGSTYEKDPLAAADLPMQHTQNMQRLQALLPQWDTMLVDVLDQGKVWQWSASRCVTHDRMPLVGSVGTAPGTHGLWMCVGMGSRGLSLAALCASALVARICGEPNPLDPPLARAIDAQRHQRKRATKV